MCYTANTQDVSHVNDTMAPKLTGRQLNYDPPNDAEADRNLQKLNEFISNRPKSDDNQIHQIILPESMTIESGEALHFFYFGFLLKQTIRMFYLLCRIAKQ